LEDSRLCGVVSQCSNTLRTAIAISHQMNHYPVLQNPRNLQYIPYATIPQAPLHTTNFNSPQHHIFTATIDTIGDAVDP
jgi:hypothetical protein